MRRIGFTLLMFGFLCGLARAQVTVDVALEQEQFLPSEDLPVAIKITNRTGRTLHMGDTEDWLTFSVEVQDNPSEIVSRLGEVPVAGEFELQTGHVATKRVNLAPYFALVQQGKYKIVPNIHFPGSEAFDIVYNPKTFYVIEGARLWERDFGVPNKDGSPNEIRKYVLQQGGQVKGKLRLYLRLSDLHGTKTFKLQPIGTLLSFSRPDPQLDRDSNLHLLYQNGPTTFSYTVYNPDGDLLIRRLYEMALNSRPKLVGDENGNIRVAGGVRRETKQDFPPNPEPSLVVPPEPDPATNATPAKSENTTPAKRKR